jgi:hypothetical protein
VADSKEGTVKAATHTFATLVALLAAALVLVVPAGAAADPYGPADGWVAGKLDYGPSDGWTARALEGGQNVYASTHDRPHSVATSDVGPPDGWMARALTPVDDGTLSPDSRAVSFTSNVVATRGSLTASAPSAGFDWTDAGIGAAAAFAALLLILFGAALTRQRAHARGELAGS